MRTYEIHVGNVQVGDYEVGTAHVGTVTAANEAEATARVQAMYPDGTVHWHNNKQWFDTPWRLVEVAQ